MSGSSYTPLFCISVEEHEMITSSIKSLDAEDYVTHHTVYNTGIQQNRACHRNIVAALTFILSTTATRVVVWGDGAYKKTFNELVARLGRSPTNIQFTSNIEEFGPGEHDVVVIVGPASGMVLENKKITKAIVVE